MSKHVRKAILVYQQALRIPEGLRDEFVELKLVGDPESRRFCEKMLGADVRQAKATVTSALREDIDTGGVASKKFYRYTISKRIAQTELFDLYKAVPDDDDEAIVIKAVREDRLDSEASELLARDMWARVVIVRKGCGDAHVVPFLHDGEWEGRHYMTMPFISGWHIDEFIDSAESNHVWARINALLTLCYALRSVHYAGIVHGDLSHRNVMVDIYCFSHIMDFGSAYIPGIAPPAVQRGTSHYVAPERCDPDATPCAAWDIYSVGMIGRELLSFECARDPRINAILAKAHAADPAERYSDITALSDDLWACVIRKGWGKRRGRRLPTDLVQMHAWEKDTLMPILRYVFLLQVLILLAVVEWRFGPIRWIVSAIASALALSG